jgi:hypothetical protein
MNARHLIAAVTAAMLLALDAVAQQPAQPVPQPAQPATPAPGSPQEAAQAQLDREWLTAYMMAHEGYGLKNMAALEDKFGKMTPTQLATLRMFYEQKHNLMVQQQQLFHQAQAHQNALAQMQLARQQQAMNAINQEDTGAANLEDQRLNIMHQEAWEASQQKSALTPYPGYFGGYRGGYYGVPPY